MQRVWGTDRGALGAGTGPHSACFSLQQPTRPQIIGMVSRVQLHGVILIAPHLQTRCSNLVVNPNMLLQAGLPLQLANLAPSTLEQLDRKGKSTCRDVLQLSSLELSELIDLDLATASDVLRRVSAKAVPALRTVRPSRSRTGMSERLLTSSGCRLQRCRLQSPKAARTCPPACRRELCGLLPTFLLRRALSKAAVQRLDRALQGGIPSRSITELVGPAGDCTRTAAVPLQELQYFSDTLRASRRGQVAAVSHAGCPCLGACHTLCSC